MPTDFVVESPSPTQANRKTSSSSAFTHQVLRMRLRLCVATPQRLNNLAHSAAYIGLIPSEQKHGEKHSATPLFWRC